MGTLSCTLTIEWSVVGPWWKRMKCNWPGRLVSILGGWDQLRVSFTCGGGNVNLDRTALVLDSLSLSAETEKDAHRSRQTRAQVSLLIRMHHA
jgi:hypothetical protein